MATYNPDTKIWSNPDTPPMFNTDGNLGQVIIHSLSLYPDQVAQISADTGVKLTGRDLRVRTIRAAENLRARGLKPGDIVAICAKNSENVAPILYATFLLLTPVNTIDPEFQIADFVNMLGQTKPKLIFCDSDNLSVIKEATEKIKLKAEFITFDNKVEGADYVKDLFTKRGNDLTFVSPKINDPDKCIAAITCSSGTTGFSKGVMFTHKSFLASDPVRLGEEGSILFTGSLYWISIVGVTVQAALIGACRIITTENYEPELYLRYIEKYRPAVLLLSPTRLAMMVNNPRITDFKTSSLKTIIATGSVITDGLRQKLNEYMPRTPIFTFYGMSESAGMITSGLVVASRPGAVGQVSPGAEVKVIDDDGKNLGVGEQGEIVVRRKIMFSGYYGSVEKTQEVIDKDGWYRTGDVGYFDNNGFLYIVDRIKDIILYNNFWIAPAPLEDKIQSLNGVEQVAVVGVPDEVAVDLPAAVVVRSNNSKITEADVARVIEDNYADAKKLRGGVYFVDSLPMTPSGKMKRRECKKIATELYKLRQSQGQTKRQVSSA